MSKGKTMPIILKKELETEVFGTGDGHICIVQKDNFGEETAIVLSANQFQTIFNHEKRIMKEAYENDGLSDSNENLG